MLKHASQYKSTCHVRILSVAVSMFLKEQIKDIIITEWSLSVAVFLPIGTMGKEPMFDSNLLSHKVT
jgi:hypothetical protein